jgi:hypothetical protein
MKCGEFLARWGTISFSRTAPWGQSIVSSVHRSWGVFGTLDCLCFVVQRKTACMWGKSMSFLRFGFVNTILEVVNGFLGVFYVSWQIWRKLGTADLLIVPSSICEFREDRPRECCTFHTVVNDVRLWRVPWHRVAFGRHSLRSAAQVHRWNFCWNWKYSEGTVRTAQ